MPRGNKDNLRVPTSEQARLNGKKGGEASAKSRKETKDIQKIMKAMLEDKVDVDGVEMTTSHALVARLFQTALDPTAKSFIEAQKMIYRMLGQDLTADDKKKIKNMLKLQEKEIELTQKKIENADF